MHTERSDVVTELLGTRREMCSIANEVDSEQDREEGQQA